MMLLIAIFALTVVFGAGTWFGLWLAGMLDAAPIIEDFDGYCAGCGADIADAK